MIPRKLKKFRAWIYEADEITFMDLHAESKEALKAFLENADGAYYGESIRVHSIDEVFGAAPVEPVALQDDPPVLIRGIR